MYKKYRLFFLVTFLLSYIFVAAQNKEHNYLRKGNEKYNSSQFDEATAHYLMASQDNPESFKANYNLGNAVYRMNKFNEALNQYNKSIKLASTIEEKAKAYHNLGDAYYRNKNYKEAEEAFKQALKNNPYDEETRYNYALAKERNKEEEKKKGKEKEDKSGENKDKKEGNQNSDNNSEDNKDSDVLQNPGGENKNEIGKGDKGNSDKQVNPVDGQTQKEFYESILNAMERKEKQTQQKVINKRTEKNYQTNDKDW